MANPVPTGWKVLSAGCLLLACCGCGSRNGNVQPPDVPAVSPLTRSQALAELAGIAPPDSVDPQLFNNLREALAAQLAEGPEHYAAAVPSAAGSQVQDLQLLQQGTQFSLHWSLANPGDYDQNGEVNVSDLTPLGIHFGEQSDNAAPLLFNPAARLSHFPFADSASVVDGDDNGEIGISDVTEIGRNFGNVLAGYHVYASALLEDYPAEGQPSTIEPLATIPLAEAQGTAAEQRLSFSLELPQHQAELNYWVVPYAAGTEGLPSLSTGAGFSYPAGSLRLVGVEPGQALPGQPLELIFNHALPAVPDTLQLWINGELGLELAALAHDGNRVFSVAPLLPAGEVQLELRDNAIPAGQVTLQLLPPQATLQPAELDALIDTVNLQLCERLEQLLDPADEVQTAELARLEQMLSDVHAWFTEGLESADPEERELVMCAIECSGYADLLAAMAGEGKQASNSVGTAGTLHLEYVEWDGWSAMLSAGRIMVDIVAVSTALMTGSVSIPVMLKLRVLLTTIDNTIDAFVPTDLADMRIDRDFTRDLDVGYKISYFRVEGLFCSEKPLLEGTLDIAVQSVSDIYSLASGIPPGLLENFLSEVNTSKLGTYLGETFLDSLADRLSDPLDPCYGHSQSDWIALDLQIYALEGLTDVIDHILLRGDAFWYERAFSQPAEIPEVASVEGFRGEILVTRDNDSIEIFEEGRHLVHLRGWSFKSESLLLFYERVRMEFVEHVEPVWAGRFGDWKPVLDVASYDWGTPADVFVLDSSEILVVNQDLHVETPYYSFIQVSREVSDGEWESQQVIQDVQLKNAFMAGGRPALHIIDNNVQQYMIADDSAGSSWSAAPVNLPYNPGTCWMLAANGKPGFLASLYYNDQLAIYWVQAKDAAGLAWEDPAYVADSLDGTPLLRSIAGVPAYAYYSSADESIYYRPAYSDDGAFWAGANLVASGLLLRELADVAGRPCVALVEEREPSPPDLHAWDPHHPFDKLYFSQADGVAGLSWTQPVKVAEALPYVYQNSIGDVSIEEIFGLPAIAYSHENGYLGYRQALDVSGAAWETPVEVHYYLGRINLFAGPAGPMLFCGSASTDTIAVYVPDLEPWQP